MLLSHTSCNPSSKLLSSIATSWCTSPLTVIRSLLHVVYVIIFTPFFLRHHIYSMLSTSSCLLHFVYVIIFIPCCLRHHIYLFLSTSSCLLHVVYFIFKYENITSKQIEADSEEGKRRDREWVDG